MSAPGKEENVARHAHDWHGSEGGADANRDGRTTRSEARAAGVDMSRPEECVQRAHGVRGLRAKHAWRAQKCADAG